jgi:hypothetical protein
MAVETSDDEVGTEDVGKTANSFLLFDGCGATALPKLNLGALSFLVMSALPHKGHCTKPRVSWL